VEIQKFLGYIIRPFRKRRMKKFIKRFNPEVGQTILDVGGSPYNWDLVDYQGSVVLLNLDPVIDAKFSPNLRFVVGDGTALAYADKAFDIVFCNSVIEHVGDKEQQQKFASEVCRVGKRVFLQTPAKSFWIEPHYVTPFIHYLPKSWQKKLLKNFSVWGLIARPSQAYVDSFVDQTKLLGHGELQQLFPDCNIYRERFLFMTKSYIVIKEAPVPPVLWASARTV
jgi:SAM-dependent methyltransferase